MKILLYECNILFLPVRVHEYSDGYSAVLYIFSHCLRLSRSSWSHRCICYIYIHRSGLLAKRTWPSRCNKGTLSVHVFCLFALLIGRSQFSRNVCLVVCSPVILVKQRRSSWSGHEKNETEELNCFW